MESQSEDNVDTTVALSNQLDANTKDLEKGTVKAELVQRAYISDGRKLSGQSDPYREAISEA